MSILHRSRRSCRIGPRATALAIAGIIAALCTSHAHADPPAPSPDAVVMRARAILDDPAYQSDRPGAGDASPAVSTNERARDVDDDARLQVPTPLAEVARLFLYCLLVATIGLLGFWALRHFFGPRLGASRSDEAAPPLDFKPTARPKIPLTAAEALAAEGRYAEAIHALLGTVLGHLSQKRDVHVAEAMTSREVVSAVSLAEDPKRALLDLVLAVEVSLFGGLDVDREDFERCMASYHRLEAALDR